jgi:hypothetical protein
VCSNKGLAISDSCHVHALRCFNASKFLLFWL